MFVCMHACMDVCVHVWLHVRMYACIYVCMQACTRVCNVCLCTHTHTLVYPISRITMLSVGLQILVLPHCTWKPCIQFEGTRFAFPKLEIHFNGNYSSPARAFFENATCFLKYVQSLTWTSVGNRLVGEDCARRPRLQVHKLCVIHCDLCVNYYNTLIMTLMAIIMIIKVTVMNSV